MQLEQRMTRRARRATAQPVATRRPWGRRQTAQRWPLGARRQREKSDSIVSSDIVRSGVEAPLRIQRQRVLGAAPLSTRLQSPPAPSERPGAVARLTTAATEHDQASLEHPLEPRHLPQSGSGLGAPAWISGEGCPRGRPACPPRETRHAEAPHLPREQRRAAGISRAAAGAKLPGARPVTATGPAPAGCWATRVRGGGEKRQRRHRLGQSTPSRTTRARTGPTQKDRAADPIDSGEPSRAAAPGPGQAVCTHVCGMYTVP